jgi:hypothetical protein
MFIIRFKAGSAAPFFPITVGSNTTPTHQGTFFWHPDKQSMVLMEIDSRGYVTEGELHKTDSGFLLYNKAYRTDGSIQDQRAEIEYITENEFLFKAAVKQNGGWNEVVRFLYLREDK